MSRYRKKPLVIEAFQMTHARRWDNVEWPPWLHAAWQQGPGEGGLWIDPNGYQHPDRSTPDDLVCGTMEGVCRIDWEDWIIRGISGEIYPCKPDIFAATYELVIEE